MAGSTGPPLSNNVRVLSRLRPSSGAPKTPLRPQTGSRGSVPADALLRHRQRHAAPGRPAESAAAATCRPEAGCGGRGARGQGQAPPSQGLTCPSSEGQLVGPKQPSQRNTPHRHPRPAGGWQHTPPEKRGRAGLGARNQENVPTSHGRHAGTAWGNVEPQNHGLRGVLWSPRPGGRGRCQWVVPGGAGRGEVQGRLGDPRTWRKPALSGPRWGQVYSLADFP